MSNFPLPEKKTTQCNFVGGKGGLLFCFPPIVNWNRVLLLSRWRWTWKQTSWRLLILENRCQEALFHTEQKDSGKSVLQFTTHSWTLQTYLLSTCSHFASYPPGFQLGYQLIEWTAGTWYSTMPNTGSLKHLLIQNISKQSGVCFSEYWGSYICKKLLASHTLFAYSF